MIGVFDSGYGGLSILGKLREAMPEYDFMYLGDNARAPYGPHSFDVVYRFTLQAVEELFKRGCPLVILACNTASAKALRTIQQNDLQRWGNDHRVLGIIRPTVEVLGELTKSHHVGILATSGTINSKSYELEINKLWGDITVEGEACPMWVPLVECGEYDTPGAEYFVEKRIKNILAKDPQIDTLILACTHYPHLLPLIQKHTPEGVKIIEQGQYVAKSLLNYLERHPEMDEKLTKNGSCRYLTTENAENFSENASRLMNEKIIAEEIKL